MNLIATPILFNFIRILSISLIFTACKKDDEIKPRGNAQAIAMYNQAYNENYDADAY